MLRRTRYGGDVSALLAGLLLVPAFAPFAWFPLALLSPAWLFWLWQTVSPRRALWRGWLYGLGMFGGGVSWLHISLAQFGGIDLPLAIGLTALFIMILALYPALLGYLAQKYFADVGALRLLLVLPAAWVLFEWLRGWLFTGFPWLLLGYSQIDSPLAHLAPLIGVYGVSWAVALGAGGLCWGLHFPQRWRLVLAGQIVLWGGAALLGLVNWTQARDAPLTVALVQGNTSLEVKFMYEYADAIMDGYMDLSAPHLDADLVIWPETAVPRYLHEVKGFLNELASLRQTHQADFVLGIPVQDPQTADYHNAILVLSEQPGFYYKHHLVPFGEYMPLRSLVSHYLSFIQIPLGDFTPGPAVQPPLSAARQVLGLSICYEDAYPSEIRRALPEASLLINISNDTWFGDSIAPHQHLQIARMRALEAGRYLLRATNTGISAVIDERGKLVAQAPQFVVQVLRSSAQPRQGSTPYVYTGEWPLLLLLALSLGLGIAGRVRGR